jgi:hypothetical protein
MVLETKHFDVVITRGGLHDGLGSTSQAAFVLLPSLEMPTITQEATTPLFDSRARKFNIQMILAGRSNPEYGCELREMRKCSWTSSEWGYQSIMNPFCPNLHSNTQMQVTSISTSIFGDISLTTFPTRPARRQYDRRIRPTTAATSNPFFGRGNAERMQ